MTRATEGSPELALADGLTLSDWIAASEGFRRFAGRLADGVYCKDLDGRFVYLNDASLRAFDLLGGAPALGQRLIDLCAVPEARAIDEHDNAALASGNAQVTTERFVAAGYARTYVVTRLPLRDAGGQVCGLACLWVERHALGEGVELHTGSQDPVDPRAAPATPVDAAFSSRLRDQFLGVVAHDLRSPLNGIQSWANVLEMQLKGDAPPLAARALAGIKAGVEEQMRLIEKLLDTTRILNGTVALTPQRVPVRPALDVAMSAVEALAGAREVRIASTFATAHDAQVNADPARLEQMVQLLLTTAIQCAPGGSEVHLELRADHDGVDLIVRDTGPIALDAGETIAFEAARQPASNERGSETGTGMDLSLVRRLAELHGGHASANVASDGHAVMSVHLPLAPG